MKACESPEFDASPSESIGALRFMKVTQIGKNGEALLNPTWLDCAARVGNSMTRDPRIDPPSGAVSRYALWLT